MKPVRTDGVHKTSDDCTDSRTGPVVDMLGWAYASFRVGSALLATDSDYQGKTLQRAPDLALSGTLLALYAISAGYGFRSATECEQVRESEKNAPPPRRRSRDGAPSPDAPSRGDAPPDEDDSADGGVDVGVTSRVDGGAGARILPAPPAVAPRPAPPASAQPGGSE